MPKLESNIRKGSDSAVSLYYYSSFILGEYTGKNYFRINENTINQSMSENFPRKSVDRKKMYADSLQLMTHYATYMYKITVFNNKLNSFRGFRMLHNTDLRNWKLENVRRKMHPGNKKCACFQQLATHTAC